MCTYFLSGERVFQGGGAVQLQGGQGGQGVRQGEGGEAERTQADPARLLQAAHQRTATSHHMFTNSGAELKVEEKLI